MSIRQSPFLKRIALALSLASALLGISISPASAWDESSLSQLQPLADKGNAEAQYFVGMLHSLGIGGANNDLKVAFYWFEKSAAGDDPLGAYQAGCYYAGQFPGAIAVDADKAFSYKLFAAKAGYALAQMDIANIYYKAGKFADAEKWWKRAADQGHPTAANNLAVLYSEDKGAPRNVAKSYTWFKIAYANARKQMDAKAQEFLDRLIGEMKPAQIAAADKQVSGWKAKPTKLTTMALTPQPRVEALLAKTATRTK